MVRGCINALPIPNFALVMRARAALGEICGHVTAELSKVNNNLPDAGPIHRRTCAAKNYT
jgi:hypothetical protein